MNLNLLGSYLLPSACHSSLKNWNEAIEDALKCVAKDPSFVKGYYRLAAAYTEVGNYDDAINALQTALTKEPGICSLFTTFFSALISTR